MFVLRFKLIAFAAASGIRIVVGQATGEVYETTVCRLESEPQQPASVGGY
jgi:hypothetical protein